MRNPLGHLNRVWRATDGMARAEALLALTVCLLIASLAGLVIVCFKGIHQIESMFDAGQAQRAFAAVTHQPGPIIGVQKVEITPREMTVWAMGPATSPGTASWRVSRWTFFGLYDWYPVSGPTPEGAASPDRGKLFRLNAEDFPDLPQLAQQARQLAGKNGNTAVASMTLVEKQVFVRLNGPTGVTEVALDREAPTPGKPAPTALQPPAAPPAAAPLLVPQRPNVSPPPPSSSDDRPGSLEAVARQQERDAPPPARAPEPPMTAETAMEKADDARARQDYSDSMHWDRVGAEMGNREAQFSLGVDYDKGEGVPEDHAEALHWYQLAADQGLPQAQSLVGASYAEGNGVTQDYAAALLWYRKAAEQNYSPAQLHLGTLYATGKGTATDYAQALLWYQKAADQGEAAAQYDVGLIYFNGLGMPPDQQKGRRWIEKAAAGGDRPAQQWLQTH